MKVAFVLPDDAPGLAERLAAATACGLRRAGHDVETFALRTAASPFPGHPGRGEIHALDGPIRAGARFDAAAAFGAPALLGTFALDASAHVHVVLDDRCAGPPAIPHEAGPARRADGARGAAPLVTTESRRRDHAARHGEDAFVLPGYVDGAAYRPSPATPDRRPLHALVEPYDGPTEAVTLADELAGAAPAVRLWHAATPSEPAGAPGGLRFADPPPAAARPAVLRGFDLYVALVPGASDLPLLEAMATGLVVVAAEAADADGLLRDGENAIVVPRGDPRAVAHAVRRAATDPDLRARLRAGALATARSRDASAWEAVATTAFLRAVALGRRPSPDDRREAEQFVARGRRAPRRTAGSGDGSRASGRPWIRRLWTAARGAVRPAAPRPAPSASQPAPRTVAGGVGAGEPVVFCGPPAYFRSAWADAVRDGWGGAYPVRLHERGALDGLPECAARAGARTCVTFDPWHVADRPAVVAALRASGIRLVAFTSEPVPRSSDRRVHWDVLRRFEDYRRARDAGFDLWIHYDPSSRAFLEAEGFRPLAVHPLPVSEDLFHPEDVARDVDVCFLGWSTPHREAFLEPLKTRLRTVHVAHGCFDEDARRWMNRSKVVVNLHAHEHPNFEARCVQALYCGRPLVSEEVSGGYLVPERDYLLARTPEEMLARVREAIEARGRAWPAPSFDRSRFLASSLRDLLRARRGGESGA